MHGKLSDALAAIDAAWALANRTPAFHDLTGLIGQVMAGLTAVKRIV
jgi:hypothetical protein